MQKKYQVFISSTFEDLRDERRLVTEQILNLGHIPIGMELFHASDDDQWTYIRRRISESDYYIVIQAERYGSVDATGMSFTEKEYRFALAENVPVAGFLLSPGARRNWPSQYVEHSRMKEINAFRDVCQRKLVRFWSDRNDLALQITNSLINLISERPRRGLAPAGDTPPEVAEELARLSKQNNELQVALQQLRSAQEANTLSDQDKEIVDALRATSLQEALTARGAPLETRKGVAPDLELWDILRRLYLRSPEAISPYLFYDFVSKSLAPDELDFGCWKEEAWQGILGALEKMGLPSASREQRMNPTTKILYNDTVYEFSDRGRKILNRFATPSELIRG